MIFEWPLAKETLVTDKTILRIAYPVISILLLCVAGLTYDVFYGEGSTNKGVKREERHPEGYQVVFEEKGHVRLFIEESRVCQATVAVLCNEPTGHSCYFVAREQPRNVPHLVRGDKGLVLSVGERILIRQTTATNNPYAGSQNHWEFEERVLPVAD